MGPFGQTCTFAGLTSTFMRPTTTIVLFASASLSAMAQSGSSAEAYDLWKASLVPAHVGTTVPSAAPRGGGEPVETCNCWIEPDSTWTLLDNSADWTASGWNTGDDGSHGPITLPFEVGFYGDLYDQVYVNINGNLSFGDPNPVYSSTGFPTASAAMVAPFWADADLRGVGEGVNQVHYKVTFSAMYVSWSNVGYYDSFVDKLNSFQLIITNGADGAVPGGNNISFCYRDMQWTTGVASSGSSGFGGTPATVGANRGNGTAYLQVGRFDAPGDAWDGPFNGADGVDWLDGRHFAFSTMDENIPPLFSSAECDTVEVEVGVSYHFMMVAHPGGAGQTMELQTSCLTLGDYDHTSSALNGAQLITASFTPTAEELGLHTLFFEATTPDGLVSITNGYVKVLASTVGMADVPAVEGLSIAPNPATHMARVQWSGPAPLELQLWDAGGRLLQRHRPTGDLFLLSTQDLAQGLYSVRAVGSQGTAVSRLIVAE